MDELIENYIEYLFNLKKKGVTITDTEHYIEKWDLNIDELILHFQKHIDLNKIFHLPKSSRFYKGHTNREKYELLVKCFTILHNYSKNLLLDFGLYSQKTIQDDNANIRDSLVFIPDYNSYLSNLLGYSYDRNKREWIIADEELTYERQMELGKFCVICGYTRHQLNRLVEINCTNDDEEENSDQIQMYDREEETPEITKWTCEKCSLINKCSDDFCVVCDTEKPTVMHILPQNMLEKSRPVKDNHPDTNRMIMKRQLSGSKRSIVEPIQSNYSKIPDSNDDTFLEPSLTAEIKERELKYEDHTLIIENSDAKTPDSNKLSIKRVKSNKSKTSNFNYKTSIYSSLPIKKTKRNVWKCEGCTLINDDSEDFCTVCLRAKPTSNVETVNKSKNDHIELNQDNTNLNSNGFQKSTTENLTTLSLPTEKTKRNQWKCEACTFINDNSEDFCTTCLHKQHIPDSSVPPVENGVTDIKNEPKQNKNISKNGTKIPYKLPASFHEKQDTSSIPKSPSGQQINREHQKVNNQPPTKRNQNFDNNKQESLPSKKTKRNEWKCDTCTFINDDSEDFCTTCLHTKPTSNVETVNKSKNGQINREHHKVNNQPPTKRNQNFDNNKQESLPKHENNSRKCKQCSQSCENSVSICDRCKISKENISPATLKHPNRLPNIKRSSSQIEVAPDEKPIHLDKNISKSVREAIFKDQNTSSPSGPAKHFEIRTEEKHSPPLPERPQNFSKPPSNNQLIQDSNKKSKKIDQQSQNKSPIHPHSSNKSTNQGQRTSPGTTDLTGPRKLNQPIESPNKGKNGDKTASLGHDQKVVCKKCSQPLPQPNNKNKTDNVCKKCRPRKSFFQKIMSSFALCGKPVRD